MKTQSHPLDDREFITAVAECTLDPSLFTHRAHLRLAFTYLKTYPFSEAADLTCTTIRNYDRNVGDGSKYHHTLTLASVKVVDHFIKKSPDADFKTLLSKYPRLMHNFQLLIDQHYSRSVWDNAIAKKFFTEPDLQAF